MITYHTTPSGISEHKLKGFFVGWKTPPSPSILLKLLYKSDYVVLAVDEKTKNVIGFVTAISDGVLSAYIPFLEVLPNYRGEAIGTELMARMLEILKGHYMIDLLCDEEVQPFYEKMGMERANGMMLRNFKKQSGE